MICGIWSALVISGGICTLALGPMLLLHGCGQTVKVGSLKGLTQRTDVHFPPGTRLIEAKYASVVMSAVLAAKVQMPRDKLDAFLSAPPFLGHTTRSQRLVDDNYGESLRLRDWRPEAAMDFVASEALYRDQAYFVAILADLDEPATAVVYLAWELM